MILTEKEYSELVKDFDSIVEKVDEKCKNDVMEQVRVLELKYWKRVREATFFKYLVKYGELNKVIWLLDAIIESKRKLRKMHVSDKDYDNLQKDIRGWQQELFQYWKDYNPDGKFSDFSNEIRKSKWIILKCCTNLYSNFIDKIFLLF